MLLGGIERGVVKKRRKEAWEDEAISDVNRISICSIIFLCCRPSLV